MTKKKVDPKAKIEIENIPLSSSLSLLAYGEVAFKQWRKVKIAANISKK
jgi:hypothetical protein